MYKVLSEQTAIKVDGKFREVKAVLTTAQGGKLVLYLDKDGNEVHREKWSRSRFYTDDGNTTEVTAEQEVWRNAYDEAFFVAFDEEYARFRDEDVEDEKELRVRASTNARQMAKDRADAVLSDWRTENF